MPQLDVQIDHPSWAHETIAWDALAVGTNSVVRLNGCTLYVERIAWIAPIPESLALTSIRSDARVTSHAREVWWRR